MRSFAVTIALLISSGAARPDGPGGHHHHGHHGHHDPHGHHAAHDGAHHHEHSAAHSSVSLGSHQVGGVVSVQPIHHAVHHQHHQEPVHVVHSVHQPGHTHHSQHSAVTGNTVVSSPVDTKAAQTVADILTSNPKFSTLLTAVKSADLLETLSQPGPYTVLAPTNTAFDKVPVDQLNSLLANKEELKKVLLRHVVPNTRMQGKNFPPGTTNLNTAAGEEISVTRDKFIQLKSSAASAYIVLFDVNATNGVIHAVDTVL